jgi:hypothetical protein
MIKRFSVGVLAYLVPTFALGFVNGAVDRFARRRWGPDYK